MTYAEELKQGFESQWDAVAELMDKTLFFLKADFKDVEGEDEFAVYNTVETITHALGGTKFSVWNFNVDYYFEDLSREDAIRTALRELPYKEESYLVNPVEDKGYVMTVTYRAVK